LAGHRHSGGRDQLFPYRIGARPTPPFSAPGQRPLFLDIAHTYVQKGGVGRRRLGGGRPTLPPTTPASDQHPLCLDIAQIYVLKGGVGRAPARWGKTNSSPTAPAPGRRPLFWTFLICVTNLFYLSSRDTWMVEMSHNLKKC
jgi:hypothetical protein